MTAERKSYSEASESDWLTSELQQPICCQWLQYSSLTYHTYSIADLKLSIYDCCSGFSTDQRGLSNLKTCYEWNCELCSLDYR